MSELGDSFREHREYGRWCKSGGPAPVAGVRSRCCNATVNILTRDTDYEDAGYRWCSKCGESCMDGDDNMVGPRMGGRR